VPHNEGLGSLAMKRNLTEQEEAISRLVHHEFGGLSRKEAAARLGITRQALTYHLKQIKQKAPQLFPILTQEQWEIYKLFQDGLDRSDVADRLCCTLKHLDAIQAQLLKKGFDCRIHRNGRKTVAYNPSMDGSVKRKF
jgi:DNA-binding NarL/FixJ family response regulator